MLMEKSARQRGETLIELLLAFAILSMALVAVMRTMNGGLDSLFVSGQRSQVEAQMRGQLSVLQAAHQEAIKNPTATGWASIINNIGNKTAGVSGDGCTYSANKNRMYFTAANGTSWASNVSVASAGAMSPTSETPKPDGASLWIEAKHTEKDDSNYTRGYYDFYIKSCWTGEGGNKQQAKMVTRLYDLEATTSVPAISSFVLTAGPGVNAAGKSCATGGNGKISYTLTNPNSYSIGTAQVTITGGYSDSVPLGAGATESRLTSAGYSAGTYTVTATIPGVGSTSSTVTIPDCGPPLVNEVGWMGSQHQSCVATGWYPCQPESTYLSMCVPATATYAAGTTLVKPDSGYILRISYGNYTGGPCGGWPSPYSYPAYDINVYINGVFCRSYALPNTGLDREQDIPLPCVFTNTTGGTQGPTVGIQWVNDWFDGISDANFRINWLSVKKN